MELRSRDLWWGLLEWRPRRGEAQIDVIYAIRSSGAPVVATLHEPWALDLIEPTSLVDHLRDMMGLCSRVKRPVIWVDDLAQCEDTMEWEDGRRDPMRWIRLGCRQCLAHCDVLVVGPDRETDQILAALARVTHTPPAPPRRVRQLLQSV